MLHPLRMARFGSNRRVSTFKCLHPTLLVGRNHEIVSSQRFALPESVVKIENRRSFLHKLRISRKEPHSYLPRVKCVGVQPTPYGTLRDLSELRRQTNQITKLTQSKMTQRKIVSRRQLTRNGNDQGFISRGKNAEAGPTLAHPRAKTLVGPSVFAISERSRVDAHLPRHVRAWRFWIGIKAQSNLSSYDLSVGAFRRRHVSMMVLISSSKKVGWYSGWRTKPPPQRVSGDFTPYSGNPPSAKQKVMIIYSVELEKRCTS